jgi:hypothetical protein
MTWLAIKLFLSGIGNALKGVKWYVFVIAFMAIGCGILYIQNGRLSDGLDRERAGHSVTRASLAIVSKALIDQSAKVVQLGEDSNARVSAGKKAVTARLKHRATVDNIITRLSLPMALKAGCNTSADVLESGL